MLGNKYAGLAAELPIAIGAALITLAGATLYTIVISKGNTKGQAWYILLGIGSQVISIWVFGVSTTSSALILNAMPAIAYMIVQLILVLNSVRKWKSA